MDIFSEPARASQRAPHVQNYRYKLINPENGRKETWTRVTTFAKTLAETSALNAWEIRNVVKGLAMDPRLMAGAADWDIAEHKAAFAGVAKKAKDLAGGNEGAARGTRMHDLTEAHDRGEEAPFMTDLEKRDLMAYTEAMVGAGIRCYGKYIERYVANPRFKVCGKFDRILGVPSVPELADYALTIGDVKSAKNIDYGWLEIMIQLWLYADATHYWDEDADDWVEMPEVDMKRAVVAHTPVGVGRCDLYEVDISAGLEAVELCEAVRHWRAKSKDLARPLWLSGPPENPYAIAIRQATCRADLTEVWRKANAARAWTKELEAMGMERMKSFSR